MLIRTLLFFLIITISGYAQNVNTIQGYVVLQNSITETGSIEYLSLVSIDVVDGHCKSQITDSNGYFQMICSGLKKNSNIELSIYKEGFEVINWEEVNSNSYLGNPKPIRIVLGNKKTIEGAYENYFKFLKEFFVSKKNFTAYIESSTNIIESLKLKEVIQTDEIESLRTSIYNQNQKIEELARELARINLDDLDNEYRKIYRTIGEGDVEYALELLSQIDFEQRFDSSDKAKIEIEKRTQNDLQALLQRARLKTLAYDYLGAIKDLELAHSKDSKNVEFLLELAYVQQLLNLNKSIYYYQEVLKHSSDSFNLSSAYNNLGVIYKNLKEFDKSEKYFDKALNLREALFKNGQVKGNYIHTLNSYTQLLVDSNNFKRAINLNNKALETSRILFLHDSLFGKEYSVSLLINAGILRSMGLNQRAKEVYSKLDSLVNQNEFKNWDADFISGFYNQYGSFLQYVTEDKREAFENYKKGALKVEKELDYMEEFYEIDYTTGTEYIPFNLGLIYHNAAKLLPDKNVNAKEEFYQKALKIISANVSRIGAQGFVYIDKLIECKLDYAFFYTTRKNYPMSEEVALNNIESSKTEIKLLEEEIRKFGNLGLLYNKIAAYHLKKKEYDSTRTYLKLAFKYIRETQQEGDYSSVIKEVNIVQNMANLYRLENNRNRREEYKILKYLRKARRKLAFQLNDSSLSKRIQYLDRLISLYKQGVEIEKINEVQIEIIH